MTNEEKLEAQGADPQLQAQAQILLAAALVNARRAVTGTLLKEGRKTEGGGGNYNYVGHEHVVSHVRKAMLENGLALVETNLELLGHITIPGKHGDQQFFKWRGCFKLMHTHGGEEQSAYECLTQANDKAGFIASTALDRTALLRLMGVAGSADEDPEHNSNNKEPATPATQQARFTERREERSTSSDVVTRQVREHINALSAVTDSKGLVVWAALLKAAVDGQGRPIDDNAKKPARVAFEARCKQLGVEVRSMLKDIDAEAARIVAERGAP